MTGRHRNPSQRLQAIYGCTSEFWRELRDIGVDMMRHGESNDRTPLRAFMHQRERAARRGIGWELSLPEWWALWTDSGHWAERGWGRGYQMCRKGDVGPYAIGNVFIAAGEENLSAASKKTKLPIGVALKSNRKGKPFVAYCNIGGKRTHLGCFDTTWEARAAYLKARDYDLALKASQPLREAA